MAPAHLGKYELRGELGRGAAGTVYDAWDPVIGRRVAIKTVKLPNANDEEAQDELTRFRREAQAAGGLNSEHIVHIHDYGETDDIAYIVMEYVGGGSLKDVLDKSGPIAATEAVRVMDELLEGLGYSHERGIVHRDIKPANIMLNDKKRVKIADFGIARIEGSSATMVGTMLGTPAYMSPEQWRGDAHIDARSDIYASGVLLYHMLTGVRPHEGGQQAIMHKVFNENPKPPSEVSIAAPPALDAVVLKAIARNADDRYATAAAFSAALKTAMSGATAADSHDDDRTVVQSARSKPAARAPTSPAAAPVVAPKPASGKAGMLIAAIIGVLVLAGGAAGWLLLRGGKPEQQVASIPPNATPPNAAPLNVAPSVPTVPAPPAPAPVVAAPPVVVAPIPAAPVPAQPAPTVPIPAPPPVVVAAPVPSLRDYVAALPCTAIYGEASANRLALHGIVPRDNFAGLRDRFDHTDATSRIWKVTAFPALQGYCHLIEVLRPVLRSIGDTGGVTAALVPSRVTRSLQLVDNDPIDFEIVAPDFASVLQVDYVGSDGKVSHYMPRKAAPAFVARRLRAGEHIRMFDAIPNGAFSVGPPYGTDLVVVIAASEPLQMARTADDDEKLDSYAKNLGSAIEAARRKGVRISVEFVPVTSVEKAP